MRTLHYTICTYHNSTVRILALLWYPNNRLLKVRKSGSAECSSQSVGESDRVNRLPTQYHTSTVLHIMCISYRLRKHKNFNWIDSVQQHSSVTFDGAMQTSRRVRCVVCRYVAAALCILKVRTCHAISKCIRTRASNVCRHQKTLKSSARSAELPKISNSEAVQILRALTLLAVWRAHISFRFDGDDSVCNVENFIAIVRTQAAN